MKISRKQSPVIFVYLLGLIFLAACNTGSLSLADLEGWNEEKISAEELADWRLLGNGRVGLWMNQQVAIEEADDSQGVMLLSPTYYTGDVVVRYQALALTAASVFVTMLAAGDSASHQLTIPGGYDGGMSLWTNAATNYFFAFKNAPHGATPFIARNPGFSVLGSAKKQDGMGAGIYYDIEVGNEKGRLWLSVDGRRLVDVEDTNPLAGGHLALRLRGSAGIKASGLIRNLTIYSK